MVGCAVTGAELAVGFLVAWMARKARRVGNRLDSEVAQALDAGVDRLHELVAGKLGADPAWSKLCAEVEQTGTGSPRTQERVRLALDDAAEDDTEFAVRLKTLIDQLQARGAVAGHHGSAVAGDVTITAEDGSAAAWQMGNVSFGGGDRADPSQPGQPTR